MSSLLKLDRVGELVEDRDNADFLRTRVADLLGRGTKSFPGAQPVSFARNHLQELQRQDYYLCEKTDGIRCLLYLTFDAGESPENDKELHFLIDRKNGYYQIHNESFHFPIPEQGDVSFHRETLLDGELVQDTMPDGTLVPRYLVFDCLALDGKSLVERTLDKRIAYCGENVIRPYHDLLRRYPQERKTQPFEVSIKKMEKAYGIEMMFREVLPNLRHGNDGLIFTCRMTPYTMGTDQHIIKWKPPHENTIDFRLQLGMFPELDGEPDYDACPELDLLVFYGDRRSEKFASLYVTDGEWESMKNINEMLDGRIIECYKDEEGRWRYKHEPDGSPRWRDDKNEANHISTVNSVLESIDDAISEQDLLNSAKGINIAWKRREAEEREAHKRRQIEEYQRMKQAQQARTQQAPPRG